MQSWFLQFSTLLNKKKKLENAMLLSWTHFVSAPVFNG